MLFKRQQHVYIKLSKILTEEIDPSLTFFSNKHHTYFFWLKARFLCLNQKGKLFLVSYHANHAES